VMGNDWDGKFDSMKQYCDVQYLERTPSISTTEIIEVVKNL
ncbi:MAG: choline-phosphate cytidylyltransferase, partial [Gammaproteobacteria bacterium]